MKWFLIVLAIGLAASDKLDRTYLPPPGAQYAGGTLGSHDAPLEPPHHSGSGHHKGESQTKFRLNGSPVNFGDKIPKAPINYNPEKLPTTTTSYAFSQTTTYPAESYGTKALPINPVTGLPIQVNQGNYPYRGSQDQQKIVNLPSYGTTLQPGFVSQGPTDQTINYGSPGYEQSINQPINQYPGQNVITPGGAARTRESLDQIQGQYQYPNPSNTQQQGLLPGAPYNQDMVNSGDVIQIPGNNQGGVQKLPVSQQGFVLSTASPNVLPGGNQYDAIYGSQGPISQGTYTGQPINVQNLGQPQPTQTSYQTQRPLDVGGNQYPSGIENVGTSGSRGFENIYQPGSTSSALSPSYYDNVSGTSPLPLIPSSTSAYSSVRPVYRPERPQAAADRNAVILNYENIRTPNGYSYSFDTSNGIHADESGIVDNGTKAQGAYSYTGDDGKVYSVIYTADENGFQPRGDHLPTPPPIPEAIQKVIEQAARDKAAGIFDDGSYDEAKYGDKKYQGITNRRRPQNRLNNKISRLRPQKNEVKPIAGINESEFDASMTKDQLNNNLLTTGPRKGPSENLSYDINTDNKNENIFGGNGRVGEGNGSKNFDESGLPLVDGGNNNLKSYETDKQALSERRPLSNVGNQPAEERPISGDGKTQTKYPGSNVSVGASGIKGNEYNDSKNQDINSGSPNLSDVQGGNKNENFDSITGTPIFGSKKQSMTLRGTENRRPGSTSNRYNQYKQLRPQDETNSQENSKPPIYSVTSNQQVTQRDENGYHYQTPNITFEQDTFPTRFSSQEVTSTMIPDQRSTGYEGGTTRKPFITPNVYNQNDRASSQSTTRRPFITVGVTSPTDSYTDYEDSDDYATDQDNDDEGIDPTRKPTEKGGVTYRPYQSTQTTSRPQYIPDGQRTGTTIKPTGSPGNRVGSSDTAKPGYSFRPTTPMTSHSSRFGSTEASQNLQPQESRPSTTAPAVGRPIGSQSPAGTKTSKYQTTGSVSDYSVSNVAPGYVTSGSVPSYGSFSSTPGVSTPQNYYTSTYRSPQSYSTTTPIPPTPGYIQGLNSQIPSRTLGFRPTSNEEFKSEYQYLPPKSDYSSTGSFSPEKPGNIFFTPTGPAGMFPLSPTGYQQGFGGLPSITTSTPGKPGTFILSQPGSTTPESESVGTYQYQNGPPSTPDYSTTIVSSTPGGGPNYGYQELFGPSTSQGQRYTTTIAPSTIGTTPGSFIPSETQAPSQGYSTTYRPGFQTTEDSFVGGPVVDGFGKPIITEQGGNLGYMYPIKEPFGPIGTNFSGTEYPTAYPGYDSSKGIGEDFSGPKQPQKFEPKTGYHYK